MSVIIHTCDCALKCVNEAPAWAWMHEVHLKKKAEVVQHCAGEWSQSGHSVVCTPTIAHLWCHRPSVTPAQEEVKECDHVMNGVIKKPQAQRWGVMKHTRVTEENTSTLCLLRSDPEAALIKLLLNYKLRIKSNSWWLRMNQSAFNVMIDCHHIICWHDRTINLTKGVF